ncbi:MAG TPA: DUF2817 domain-containing protein [Anaerolineales bacterium]|nr:DUF2817 domain-containing protein [Anaerolineales bacterium]
MNPEVYFSSEYQKARSRFVAAVEQGGGRLSHLACQTDEAGRELVTDIAWFGHKNPRSALLLVSGVHGVEGFAGSAVQLAALNNLSTLQDDTALVLIHALNPYGMANLRRFNGNNVDLNRNFHFSNDGWQGEPDGYAALDKFFNPTRPPSFDFFYFRVLLAWLRFGNACVRQAVTGGQYHFPLGLYYGGNGLEQEAEGYIDWLKESSLLNLDKLMVIDIHTGLGRFGQQSLFMRSGPDQRAELSRRLGVTVTPSRTELKTMGYHHGGGSSGVYRRLFNGGELTCLTVEYGTYPGLKMLHALRAENQHHHYGDKSLDHWSKRSLKEAFCPKSKDWQRRVVTQGSELVERSVNFISLPD